MCNHLGEHVFIAIVIFTEKNIMRGWKTDSAVKRTAYFSEDQYSVGIITKTWQLTTNSDLSSRKYETVFWTLCIIGTHVACMHTLIQIK